MKTVSVAFAEQPLKDINNNQNLNNMGKKEKQKTAWITTEQEFTFGGLVDMVSGAIDHDDAAEFIAKFEQSYASWELTIDLIRHFKALEEIYLKEFSPEERDGEDLSPKLIKTLTT